MSTQALRCAYSLVEVASHLGIDLQGAIMPCSYDGDGLEIYEIGETGIRFQETLDGLIKITAPQSTANALYAPDSHYDEDDEVTLGLVESHLFVPTVLSSLVAARAEAAMIELEAAPARKAAL